MFFSLYTINSAVTEKKWEQLRVQKQYEYTKIDIDTVLVQVIFDKSTTSWDIYSTLQMTIFMSLIFLHLWLQSTVL